MDTRYSAVELLNFLQQSKKKGLLNPKTAKNRRVAALRVFSVLDEQERQDLREVDLDSAFRRFAARSGRGVAPKSLATYQSRMRAALEDFVQQTDGLGIHRPNIPLSPAPKRSGDSKTRKLSTKRRAARKSDRENSTSLAMHQAPGAGVSVPLRSNLVVQIRDQLVVQIRDLPPDLTLSEADRIAAVLKALVVPTQGPVKRGRASH